MRSTFECRISFEDVFESYRNQKRKSMTDKASYKEQLPKLIGLRGIDAEIFDLRSKKESFPVRIKELEDSVSSKKGSLGQAEDEYKRLQVSKNEKENEMQAKEEKIKKHEADLYQLKNNVEYKVKQDEIASVKADVSLIEDEIIRLFDEIEAAKGRVEKEKAVFEEEKKKIEREKQEIKAEEQELDKRLGELTAKRAEYTNDVTPELLAEYERILEKRGRVALARIAGEFCGECNMQLRPQVINDVKLRNNPVFCENCARMLYEEE